MSDAYRRAGVDIEAGNELVERIKPALTSNQAIGLLPEVGGFAALCRVPSSYENPVLVLGTDGVGTKLDLLLEHARLDTVGYDLVAMCVNDLLVYGAKPALFLDYYATERLDVDQAEVVIKSIAEACDIAGCALVGGETAEMPGFYPDGKFDLAGFCVGWVEEAEILRPDNVQAGDVILGLPSSGPHSNGFSLIRSVLHDLQTYPDSATLSALLEPTRIYAKTVLPLADELRAMAHITGGGFKDNVPRAFSRRVEAHIDTTAWSRPAIFRWLQDQTGMSDLDMLATFNCGLGMLLFVAPDRVADVTKRLTNVNEPSFRIGEVHACGSQPTLNTLVISKDEFKLAERQ